jgi:hypothetical protein
MKPTPHEVRVTFVMFSDALLDEAYIDATESLVELYEYAKQGVKIPYESWIRDRLPEHKTGIMKRIFRYVKNYDQKEINRYVPLMIAALRHFGITWPELDVVSKSIDASKNLKENEEFTDEFVNYVVNSIEDSLKYGTFNSVMRDIGNLYRNRRWPDAKDIVLDLLAQHKNTILHGLDMPVGSTLLAHINRLLDIGIDWPEFTQYLDDKKPKIIKWLLTALTQDGEVYLTNTIPGLIKRGLDWPELHVILKGATSEVEKYKDLDESDMSLAELDDYMRIEQNFNRNEIYYALLLIDKNDFNVVKYPDIGHLLDDQQNNIREFMLHRLDRKDVFEFIRIADMLKSTRIGWTWPAELVEQKKREVVKLLLSLRINPYSDPEVLLDLSWMLKKIGIAWPELDAIEKSVRSETKNLNESDDDDDNRVYNVVYKMFDSPYFMYVFSLSSSFSIKELRKNPEVKTLFYKNMPAIGKEIVRSIIKDQTDHTLTYVINGLTDFGIILPNNELRAVLKKYKSKIKKTLVYEFIDGGPGAATFVNSVCNKLKQLGIDINAEKIVDININKTQIIIHLLQTLKHEQGIGYIITYIESLRRLGADWPELSIIEKSVRKDMGQQ